MIQINKIIQYSFLIYFLGVLFNFIVVYNIPEEYFKSKKLVTRDTGYIVSIIPFILSIPALYFFITESISILYHKIKLAYIQWRIERQFNQLMEEHDIDKINEYIKEETDIEVTEGEQK